MWKGLSQGIPQSRKSINIRACASGNLTSNYSLFPIKQNSKGSHKILQAPPNPACWRNVCIPAWSEQHALPMLEAPGPWGEACAAWLGCPLHPVPALMLPCSGMHMLTQWGLLSKSIRSDGPARDRIALPLCCPAGTSSTQGGTAHGHEVALCPTSERAALWGGLCFFWFPSRNAESHGAAVGPLLLGSWAQACLRTNPIPTWCPAIQ